MKLLKQDSNRESTNRNVICQKDKNNFVVFSGSNSNLYLVGKEMKEFFGCKIAVNLDGGGSRKLYYKSSIMNEAVRKFGGDRKIPDMLYFNE